MQREGVTVDEPQMTGWRAWEAAVDSDWKARCVMVDFDKFPMCR